MHGLTSLGVTLIIIHSCCCVTLSQSLYSSSANWTHHSSEILLVVVERVVQLLLVSLVVFHMMMQTGYSLMGLLFQLVQLPQLIAITLHRGDNSFSPTGQYCCVIPPDATYNAIVSSHTSLL